MKQGKLKKYLAAMLSAAMVLSCFPTAAIGAESTDAEAIVDEAETAIDDAADVEEALDAEDVEVGGVEEEVDGASNIEIAETGLDGEGEEAAEIVKWTVAFDEDLHDWQGTYGDTGIKYHSGDNDSSKSAVSDVFTHSATTAYDTLQGKINGTVANNILTGGAYVYFIAPYDGTLTIRGKSASGKAGYISTKTTAIYAFTGGENKSYEGENFVYTSEGADGLLTVKLFVVKGEEYRVGFTGSKIVGYGGEFIPSTTVSGNISIPDDSTIKFTNIESNRSSVATVVSGNYSVSLEPGEYKALITGDASKSYALANDSRTITVDASSDGITPRDQVINLNVDAVMAYTVSGQITGYDDGYDKFSDLKLVFSPENKEDHEDVIADLTGKNFSAVLIANDTYTASLSGGEDYKMAGIVSVNSTGANVEKNIPVEKLPTYKVTVDSNVSANELSTAKFTFARLDGEDHVASELYKYDFTGTENISLRDGVYGIKVTDSGKYVQKLTANVKVNGAAVTTVINFDDEVTSWKFSDDDFINGGYNEANEEYVYKNLIFKGSKINKTYLLGSTGTIKVPLYDMQSAIVTVKSCYEYHFTFEGAADSGGDKKTESTSTIDSFTYKYNGGALENNGYITIHVNGTSYLNEISISPYTEYKSEITVGKGGDYDYTSVGDAIAAIRNMDRGDKWVTVKIQPGNYEEIFEIDTDNVSLVNASETPSIDLKNNGKDIDDNAVRITFYYGVGYDYYSMGSDYRYDPEVLAVNKANGYQSQRNGEGGSGSYWNATVVISAENVSANGIIFENSFNQYVSELASKDVIVRQTSGQSPGKEPEGAPRADLPAGSTEVQKKAYTERAAAVAIKGGNKVFFDNCKFVSHQDTLYGDKAKLAGFYNCDIYGTTDYIFGGMSAVFAKCNFVANNIDASDGNDEFYITAAQHDTSKKGYLMYNCNVVSAKPQIDSIATTNSRQGWLGRPWAADTEVVFYGTNIDVTNIAYKGNTILDEELSLIYDGGWEEWSGRKSVRYYEFGTHEKAKVNKSRKRVSWANPYDILDNAKLSDGTRLNPYTADDTSIVTTFLGSWDPFVGKDMELDFEGYGDEIKPGYEITVKGVDDHDAPVAEEAGKTVSFNFTIKEGYEYKSISAVSSNSATVDITADVTGNNGVASFVMPSGEVNITIKTDAKSYDIINATTDKNVKVSIAENAKPGDEVSGKLTFEKGYKLDKLTIVDENGNDVKFEINDNDFTFVMPASKVTITVTAKETAKTPETETETKPAVSDNGFTEADAEKTNKDLTDKLGDKSADGVTVPAIQAKGDTVMTELGLKKGKVKTVSLGTVSPSVTNRLTINTKVKLQFGTGWTVDSISGNGTKKDKLLNKYNKSLAKGKPVVLKADVKGGVYVINLVKDDKTTRLALTVVDTAISKDVKKLGTLKRGTGVSANAVSANYAPVGAAGYTISGNAITIGTTPVSNRFLSGVWTIGSGKNAVNAKISDGAKTVTIGKQIISYKANEDGTITVAPGDAATKGSIKLTYSLNGKTYKTAVKLK